MKKRVILLMMAAFGLSNVACASGRVAEQNDNMSDGQSVSKEFSLSGFTAIDCRGVARIVYSHGSGYSVKATGDSELMERTLVSVEGKTLSIRQKSDSKSGRELKKDWELTFYVTSPDLEKVDLSGVSSLTATVTARSVDFDASGTSSGKISLEADALAIDVSGATNFDVYYKGKSAEIDCSGAGKLTLRTECQYLRATNSGATQFKISGTADDTKIKVAGVAKIDTSELNTF